MRQISRFFSLTFVALFIALLFCVSLNIVVMSYQTRHESFDIPKHKHILVVGNSQGECAFNDTILTDWKNIAKSGQFFIEANSALDKTLESNPQIDTVLIAAGIPSFHGFTDCGFRNRDIQNMRAFSREMFLNNELLTFESNNCVNFIPYMLTSGIDGLIIRGSAQGKYLALERHALIYGDKGGILQYEAGLKENGRLYPLDKILECHSIQIDGIKRLIATCEKYGAVCIFINTPLYNIEKYVDDRGYKDLLLSLDDTLKIADFSNFEFPDTSYYGDVNHLNYGGSVYFSKYIQENGLNLQTIKEYASQNSVD